MELTDDVLRSWGWSEDDIAWFREDRHILRTMPLRERGWYEGVAEAFLYDNAMQESGVSHHRLPTDPLALVEDDFHFNFRHFLAVLAHLDDDGHIYRPGYQGLNTGWGPDDFLFLHCTEAASAVEDPKVPFPTVAWGYREAMAAWKEAHA